MGRLWRWPLLRSSLRLALGVRPYITIDDEEGETVMTSTAKTCRTCHQPLRKTPVIEDRSENGVTVIKYRFKSGSTYVDASCQCFGHKGRVHSSESCSLLHTHEPRRRDERH